MCKFTAKERDAAGNLLNDGTNQYLYDGAGRLCAVQAPTTLTGYAYDSLGRRAAKGSLSSFSCNIVTNGFAPSAEYIVGLNGEQLGETDGGYNLLHSNVFAGGHLLATYENSNWYYALNDWLGTKRVEANADGSVAATFVSLPFGDGLDQQVSGPDATEHHFTGKERDAETGNDYFGARYYGSTMGRFLSPDYSDTPEAMPYADLSNPQSFNRYVYLNDNPLSGIDADGHDCGVPIQENTGKAGAPIETTPCKSAAAQQQWSLSWQISASTSFLEEELKGVADVTVTPAVQAVEHPVDTAEGIANAVAHPVDTAKNVANGAIATAKAAASGDPRAIGQAVGLVIDTYIAVRGVQGKEIKIGDNLRIAPAGNRTGGLGELPHYHRRIVGPDGKTVPGGGIGWHRPWEP